jgi:GNAT superfamily N-acetyltransferase
MLHQRLRVGRSDGLPRRRRDDVRGCVSERRVSWACRPLDAHDLEAFQRLRVDALTREQRAFGSSPDEHLALGPDEVARRLRPTDDNFVIGAFEGAALVGTAGFRREDGRKSRHKALVWGVYVDPSHRGRGIGQEIMLRLIERARSIGAVERLLLCVTTDDRAAHRLYLRLGFVVYGTESHALKLADGAYVDENLMVLAL